MKVIAWAALGFGTIFFLSIHPYVKEGKISSAVLAFVIGLIFFSVGLFPLFLSIRKKRRVRQSISKRESKGQPLPTKQEMENVALYPIDISLPIVEDQQSGVEEEQEEDPFPSDIHEPTRPKYTERNIVRPPLEEPFDELLPQALEAIVECNSCSVSMLQRRLKLGYSRGARIVDQLEMLGAVGPYGGERPRVVLVTRTDIPDVMQRIRDWQIEQPEIDTEEIISAEHEWLREQRGFSPVENELYQIDLMDGHAFEYWCAERLKKAGFSKVTVTPGSNDQGVDVLAEKDCIKYAVQCKCYASDLGNTPVQEVNAGKSFYHCHVGAVMTNRYFTQGAKDLASATGTLLWDRDYIKDLLDKEFGSVI